MGKQIAYETGISYVSNGLVTRTLPNVPISKIIIKHRSGSLSGGTTGSYVANSLIKYMKLKLAQREFESWDGDAPADEPSYGILALRTLNKYMNKVADVNEYFTISLPDAIPADIAKVIQLQFNPIDSINDGDRTGYDGTIDIYYEMDDIEPEEVIVRKVINNKRNVGTKTQDTFYLDAPDENFFASHLVLYAEDNGTALTEAQSKTLSLEFYLGSDTLWSGTLADLIAETTARAGVSFSASEGLAVLPLGGLQYAPNELKVVARLSSALTDLDLHYWLAQLAEA